MSPADTDPRRIRSLAVGTDDVVAAYEARQRSPRRTVLRATPPFSGRMRARLHDPGFGPELAPSASGEETDADLDPETGAVHVPPGRLLDEDALPAYPSPDDTEDELRADPDEAFSVERHRERHAETVEAWRAAVADAIAETVELRTTNGPHRVAVKKLG